MSNVRAADPSELHAGSDAVASRRAGWFWGTIVIAFLAGQVVIGVAAYILANNDPSVAVVPGYHERASLWDNSAELRRQSKDLGWTVEYEQTQAGQGTKLRCNVADANGESVTEATGQLTLFHHARASSPIVVSLKDAKDGVDVNRAGLWQLEMLLDAKHDGLHFFDSQVVNVRGGS
jgi:nitrogen fixation protein FixH